MPLTPECQVIADNIAVMQAEKLDLQLELQTAPTNQKAGLAAQIKALIKAIGVAEAQLVTCIATHPDHTPPPPPALDSNLTGTVTLTTSYSRAPGPYVMPIMMGVLFNGARTYVGITSFPPIATAPFSTPFGPNVCTVTKTGGGAGAYVDGTGEMDVPIKLHFNQSIDLPFYNEDSDLSLILSANAPGSQVDANGDVTLVGTGTFEHGILGGSTGTITLTGRFLPKP